MYVYKLVPITQEKANQLFFNGLTTRLLMTSKTIMMIIMITIEMLMAIKECERGRVHLAGNQYCAPVPNLSCL